MLPAVVADRPPSSASIYWIAEISFFWSLTKPMPVVLPSLTGIFRFDSTERIFMFAVLLNAARLAAPAASGPLALVVLPTLAYILATRKIEVSVSFR